MDWKTYQEAKQDEETSWGKVTLGKRWLDKSGEQTKRSAS